ncbi:uncharacterized protein LOC62_01G000212 [Vanrija pseudolonga]|uniref:PAS domain-containing protein n=1 Tax=Vanrija pseudolonga TaxID=143232 RepID=A0AAF0XZ69_9TREE|nr:hypothetical protein LOC62_01G000212 [Vanrija pseudolonga]
MDEEDEGCHLARRLLSRPKQLCYWRRRKLIRRLNGGCPFCRLSTLPKPKMYPSIDFNMELPAQYIVPTHSDNPDDPMVPARPNVVTLPPCTMPAYDSKPRRLPSNLEMFHTEWMLRMDTDVLPLIGVGVSDMAIQIPLASADVTTIDKIYDDRRKVLTFVYSVARILLFVNDNDKLQLNSELAYELWGVKGNELLGRLDPDILGCPAVDAAEQLEDRFFEELRLHTIARHLESNGWSVPGMTPVVFASFSQFDHAPRKVFEISPRE